MARMKRGEKGHNKAVDRWHETMNKRYGSASDFMKKIGAKGGQNGHTGGFNADPNLAKIAGAIGGLKSKRGKSHNKEWEKKRKLAQKYFNEDCSIAEIARRIDMPYGSVLNRINQELEDGTF